MTRISETSGSTEIGSARHPALITEAQSSIEEQHRARVRKYMFIMSFRIPALVLAAISYSMWANPWIAMAIVGASIPLPWMAVLIANDRPPRSADEVSRFDGRVGQRKAVESRDHRVIDASED
ncbi:DUF3099 domain-containing protein [Rhodococcus sp. BGS-1C]|jgi:hypothetical protein|uniref:DUF3099 domain-containing protein n=1 Tax=Nocardiaceae TaxID=85025 RepID=UPI000968DAE6|nr:MULTISPECIES: DUF3099 domain-containing protein [Rhodococcus]MCC8926199.1 DUF3099 domain-containing protein [Rhodococcus sp. I2R]MCZ4274549.1 DUF3099 domain-containing protein [Rhodococcus yunnanensis]OLT32696.1 hypothetical protein BJF84_00335 [Rhodococcus sp. CUA-806]